MLYPTFEKREMYRVKTFLSSENKNPLFTDQAAQSAGDF